MTPLKFSTANIITGTHTLIFKLSDLALLVIPEFLCQGESGNRHGDN